MSRKNKKDNKDKGPQTPARFAVGALVRVKPGTTTPDYPDVPLGGWTGTIQEVDRRSSPPLYYIEWNQYTLDHMHPVYRNRCERDGMEYGGMFLDEKDLEPDPGGPAAIEQPTHIATRPLNAKNEDDRVCMALGLTSNDPLPEVDEDTLRTYYRYLAARLAFPSEARWDPEDGRPAETVTLTGLSGPEDHIWVDEMYGLLVHARAGPRRITVPLGECKAKKGSPNRQLLQDYAYWFWNYR